MKLTTLRLKNFKGIKSFTLDLQGKNASVLGDNAAGKSTLADAFYWLLTDKDSHNRKDFEIKTLDEKGEPLHGLDHEVEATFELPGGTAKTLKKTYREKWTQQRGKPDATFSGHSVDHAIDNVPVKAGKFKDAVDQVMPDYALRLLTDPRHFNVNMHWEERRVLLLDVCGDVEDPEVFDADPKLKELEKILSENKHSAEDFKKVIVGSQKEIQKELDRIPTRIDEVNHGLPNVEDIDPAAHQKNIEKLRKDIEKLEKEKGKLQSTGGAADLENEIAILNAKLQNARNRAAEEADEKIRPLKEKMREKEEQLSETTWHCDKIKRTVKDAQAERDEATSWLDIKTEEAKKIRAEEFSFEQSNTCPTCGQGLPKEKLKEAREKAEKQFNADKANQLEALNTEINRYKNAADDALQTIRAANSEQVKAEKEMDSLEKEIDSLHAEITKLKDTAPADTPEIKRIETKKAKLEKELENIEQGSSDKIQQVQDKITDLQSDIRQSEKALLLVDQQKKGKARIDDLKKEERRLAAEYEELERQLFLIEEFTRVKVRLLENKINSRFDHARFKLFEQHINGGISETCICLYSGVPYNAGLNAGHQIIVGLDIIATLAEYYEFWPPVFVDNAESITDLPDMKQQTIKLVKPEISKKADRAKYQKLVVEGDQ